MTDCSLCGKQLPCIEAIGHGFKERISFTEFAQQQIQDTSVACEIARKMLDGNDPYPYNEDEPEFFTEFSIYDREEFIRQLQEAEGD